MVINTYKWEMGVKIDSSMKISAQCSVKANERNALRKWRMKERTLLWHCVHP